MIYTVGKTDIYEDCLKNDKYVAKRKNGSVWQTYKDAQKYLEKFDMEKEYNIYAVDADWNLDTEIVANLNYRILTRDSKLIKVGNITEIFPWIK